MKLMLELKESGVKEDEERQEKTSVSGLLKRNGKMLVKVVNDCNRKELIPIIKDQILEETAFYIDGWRAYHSLAREGYKHHRVHQHKANLLEAKTI